jgi:hypothetical protein
MSYMTMMTMTRNPMKRRQILLLYFFFIYNIGLAQATSHSIPVHIDDVSHVLPQVSNKNTSYMNSLVAPFPFPDSSLPLPPSLSPLPAHQLIKENLGYQSCSEITDCANCTNAYGMFFKLMLYNMMCMIQNKDCSYHSKRYGG